MRLAERVSQSNAAVLISGESGTGKELVARAIHQHSLRCSCPFVDINCAALPEHLVESELFGYEKGAFSGADAQKPGLFELAHTGTLFLDEVGDLDLRTQVKLLRVLDGAPYYRLGGTRKVCNDVRIVAATNQDLEEAIDSGKFRRDLYHRLSQVHIKVPPLRERPDDIVPLAEFFLRCQGEKFRLADDCKLALRRHAWPGNAREMRNLVTKACILAESSDIHACDFPELRFGPVELASSLAARVEPKGTLDEMERLAILEILGQTGGHHQRAAAILGISCRTLARKLKVYRISQARIAG